MPKPETFGRDMQYYPSDRVATITCSLHRILLHALSQATSVPGHQDFFEYFLDHKGWKDRLLRYDCLGSPRERVFGNQEEYPAVFETRSPTEAALDRHAFPRRAGQCRDASEWKA